jgi:N-formylglutamate deformylase
MTVAYEIRPPVAPAVPLVLDSPHSSAHFPPDFGPAVPEHDLREGEDMYIDELYRDAPAFGATLLEARFARTYIDPNRHRGDVDLDLLDEEWPHEYVPSGKARIGKALIWRTLEDGRQIYRRKLTVAEVLHRIEHYLLPYQQALARLIDETHARHGVSYHLNCHSMRAVAGPMGEGGEGSPRADVVLGDRDGTTCSTDLTMLVRDTFVAAGYSVRINDPYKGVELVRAFSSPDRGRHSLQIELNKRLYMDERQRTRSASFETVRRDLGRLLSTLAAYSLEQSRT